jgi:hypothetical protein
MNGLIISSEKPPATEAFRRAREFIQKVRDDGQAPTFREILNIYRMAMSPGGNIFYRCNFK